MTAVRVFEAAARLGSFTAAAAELGTSQAAVSYQVKLLEERLQQPLFLRKPRRIELTDAGRRLAPAVTDAFEALATAFAALDPDTDTVLSVTSMHLFASNWLAPRLGVFHLAHPDIAVRLSVNNRVVDFGREEIDVGIRYGHGQWPGLDAHLLFRARFAPVASPGLLAAAGGVREPADLLKLPLLTPTDPWWRAWFDVAGVAAPGLETQAGFDLDSQQVEGAAAIAGQGVAIVWPFLWASELAAGRLVRPFSIEGEDRGGTYLVYARARRAVRKIRVFRDWLLAEVARYEEAA